MTTDKVILQFSCMHSTKYGAVEAYFRESVKYCREKGYLTVLQYESMPQSADYLKDLSRLDARILVRPVPLSVFGAYTTVRQVLREVRPVLVHAHFAERFVKMWIPLLARRAGVARTLCSVHNIPEYKGKTWARHIYNLYDKVLAVSKAAEDGCLTGGVDTDRLVTHYLGLFGERKRSAELRQTHRSRMQIPDNAVVIACIAFDTPFKGLDLLLKAFQLAGRNESGLHLVQIGVDPEQSRLPALAAELGIADRVHWAGIIDEGWRVLNAADIYMQPSRFSEGLGLAIVEAMALRLPVIGTNIGGIPEAVIDGETGIITEPDAEKLAGAINGMLSDRETWMRMGEAGYERYRKVFDGPHSVSQLVDQYYFADEQ
ncbi:MAG: glycosyltransferase family 4 protein [Candidatus Omnitrophica bacterium]|nr:glycosyltransferase family 4 protein [Candidatus Omnitrophota bacterium]